jgi:RNA polymerase primary sigma factor
MEAIKQYLKEVRAIPLLSPQEEIELCKGIKKGDSQARQKMIRANLRLVINIAKRYMHLGIPLLDLIEEGNMGLMKAVDKFNPKKGYRFSTYAAWWIKQSITRAISEQSKMIRIPVYMNELIAKYKKITNQLSQKLGRAPLPGEIAKRMKLSIEKVKEIESWITKISSLEEPIGDEGEEVKDLIVDRSLSSPKEEISHFLEKERIENLLERINGREKEVLDLRFGLANGQPHTLAEIAKKIGVSRERVRQIEEVALKKLRKFVSAQEKERLW